jgi:hypothetical protein
MAAWTVAIHYFRDLSEVTDAGYFGRRAILPKNLRRSGFLRRAARHRRMRETGLGDGLVHCASSR